MTTLFNGPWLPVPDPDASYVRRGGLLVPADLQDTEPPADAAPAVVPGTALEPVVVEPELVGPDDGPDVHEVPEPVQGAPGWLARLRRRPAGEVAEPAEVLAERLDADRAVIEVGREDELARRSAAAEHQMALDDVDEQAAAVRRERAQRARNAAQAEKLAALHQHTASAGERARIAAELSRTAEMRALRVAKTQKVALLIGLGLLLGFGGWSTAGVHDGLVTLMDLRHGSFGWWAGWVVEPLLITIVAGLILLRAILKTSGGDVDSRARRAEAAALGFSIALNMLGGWHGGTGTAEALGQALAHSVGALGAAGTAWLIGVVIDYTTSARPWDNAPRVADLVLDSSGNPSGEPSAISSATASARAPETGIRRGKRGPLPVDRGALPDDFRKLLDDVREAITDGRLKPDPSAYSIYNQVMHGRGDRSRSTEIAGLVRGWRPLRAVDGGVRDVAS